MQIVLATEISKSDMQNISHERDFLTYHVFTYNFFTYNFFWHIPKYACT
jgi:hypothetical protein